jgi:uncharacterized protein (TIGR03066 family)
MHMKPVHWVLVVGLVFLVSSGPAVAAKGKKKKGKAKDLIVGKWEPVKPDEKRPTLEFTSAGVVKIVLKSKALSYSIEGKYKFLDDMTFEVTLNSGKEKKEKVKIKSVTKSRLVLVDQKGKTEAFKKVK